MDHRSLEEWREDRQYHTQWFARESPREGSLPLGLLALLQVAYP